MGDLDGTKIVLTGTFTALKRADAQARLEAMGADVTGSVSKHTALVFAGEKAGSKLARAEELGVPVFGESELLETLESGQLPTGATVAPPSPRAPRAPRRAKEAAAPPPRAAENASVVGKRFVITGEITGYDRTGAKDALTALGAVVTGSVSGRTDYVVAGTDPGANKLGDAERHDVPVLTEDQLLRLLAGEDLDDVVG